jgi:Histidine kinase-like ATPase domain
MITDISLEQLQDRIGPVLDSWTDEVTPGEVELLPNHRYSPRYAWMFSYEKQVRYRLQGVLNRQLGELERRLFGPDGALSEALSNAFVHGHLRDAERTIRVSCTVSEKAVLVSIEDEGTGFNVPEMLCRMKQRRNYYRVAGNGLRALDELPGVVVIFDRGGRRVHIRLDLDYPGKR